MPYRNEVRLARLRLEKTSLSDDADLVKLQKEAADYIREAKCLDRSGPDDGVSNVLDAVARDYFQHIVRKRRRGT